jgi:carotenoid cleavage dioxygenase
MTAPFPAPMKFGQDEPLRFEGEIIDLELIEGEIPADLEGLLTQAVPEYLYPPVTKTLFPMDMGAGGDGMVRAFRFGGGKVDFATKFVKTERFLAQRKAKRGLFGQYRNPYTDDPAAAGIERTTANTGINFHNGVLLAAKEDGLSYMVNALTLETIGKYDANGAITSKTLSAHVRMDPKTGEMLTFGYFADGIGSKTIRYYVVDKGGKVTHSAVFQAPEAFMVHDCGATDNYFLFPLMQFSTDVERIKQGGPFYVWEPDAPMIMGVIPRYGSGDQVKWLRGPNCVLTHTINTFEEDGLIKFDVLRVDGNCFGFIIPDLKGRGGLFGEAPTRLVRWTIDPNASDGRITEFKDYGPVRGEGAHIDDRWAGRRHRYIWLPELHQSTAAGGAKSPPPPPPPPQVGRWPGEVPAGGGQPRMGNEHGNSPTMFNAITRIDMETGERRQWFAGEGVNLQDPVFCPRSANAPEGDGYIVGIRNRHGVRGGELVILEAMNIEKGPICVINVPVPLKLGIHSAWLPGYRYGEIRA